MNFHDEQRNNFRLNQSISGNGLFTVIERKPLSSLENNDSLNTSSLSNSLNTSKNISAKNDVRGSTDNICELYRLNSSQLLNENLDFNIGGKISFLDDDVSSFYDSDKNEEIYFDDDLSTLCSNYSANSPVKNNSPKKTRTHVSLNDNNKNRKNRALNEDAEDEYENNSMLFQRNVSDISNDEVYAKNGNGEKAIRLNKNIYRIDNVNYDEHNKKENVIKKVKQIRNSMISEHESIEGNDVRLDKLFEDEEGEREESPEGVAFHKSRRSEKPFRKYNEGADLNKYHEMSKYNSDKKIKYRNEHAKEEEINRFGEQGLAQYENENINENEDYRIRHNINEKNEETMEGELKRKIIRGGHIYYDNIPTEEINMVDNIMHRKSKKEFDKFFMGNRNKTISEGRIKQSYSGYYDREGNYYENSFHRRESDNIEGQYMRLDDGNEPKLDINNKTAFVYNEKGDLIHNELKTNKQKNLYPYKNKNAMPTDDYTSNLTEERHRNEDAVIYYKRFSKMSVKNGENVDIDSDNDMYISNDKILGTEKNDFAPYQMRNKKMEDDAEYAHMFMNERNNMRKSRMLTNNNYTEFEKYHSMGKRANPKMSYGPDYGDNILNYNNLSENRHESLHGINKNRNVSDDELFYENENINKSSIQHMHSITGKERERYYHHPNHPIYRNERYEPGLYNIDSYENLPMYETEASSLPAPLYKKHSQLYGSNDNNTYIEGDDSYYYKYNHMNSKERMNIHYANERNHPHEDTKRIDEMEYEEEHLKNGRQLLQKNSCTYFHNNDSSKGYPYVQEEGLHMHDNFEAPLNYINGMEIPQHVDTVEDEARMQNDAKVNEVNNKKEGELNKEKVENVEIDKTNEEQKEKGINENTINEEKKTETTQTSVNEKTPVHNANLEKTQGGEVPKEGTTDSTTIATTTAVDGNTTTTNTETIAFPLQPTFSANTPSVVVPPVAIPPAVVPPAVVPSAVVPSAVVPSAVVPSAVVPSTVVPSTVVPSTVVPSTVVPSAVPPAVPPTVPPVVTPPAPAAPVKRKRGRPKVKKGPEETVSVETQQSMVANATSTTPSTNIVTNLGANIGTDIVGGNTVMQPPLSHNMTSNFGNISTNPNVAFNHMNTANTILTDLNQQPMYSGINAFNTGMPVNMNHLNQMNQMNQINQMNHLKQMDQLNQMNVIDSINQHMNQQINPAMKQQMEQMNMHMNLHPQFNQPMFNNVNPQLNQSMFTLPNRMNNASGANIQGIVNDEQFHMYNNNEYDNEMANNNNMNNNNGININNNNNSSNNNNMEQEYYCINVNNIENKEDYPYGRDGKNEGPVEHKMNENDGNSYNNNNSINNNEEFVNYGHNNKRYARSGVSESEERDSERGYKNEYPKIEKKKRREMEDMGENINNYETKNSTEMQDNDINDELQEEDSNENSGYSTFIDENNKKATYKVAYHPADAIWEKVSGVKFGPMILTAQSRTTNVILSKKRSIELGNILHNLIYGYIYKGDNVRLTIGKESKNVMCGSAFFLPSFMDCSIHNDDESGSAKLFLCFVYLNSS